MFKLELDEEKVIEQVLDFQNGNKEVAEDVYFIYKNYLDILVRKHYHLEDLEGRLNERFMYCMNHFVPQEKPSFSKYLFTYIHFEIKLAYGYKAVRGEGGVTFTAKNRKPKIRRGEKPLALNRMMGEGRNKVNAYELVEDPMYQHDIYDAEFLRDLNDAMLKYKVNERDKKLIHLVVSGYNQAEIGEELGISQSRVSSLLKNFLDRNREFALHIVQTYEIDVTNNKRYQILEDRDNRKLERMKKAKEREELRDKEFEKVRYRQLKDLTTADYKLIIREYKKGLEPKEISKKHRILLPTVQSVLKRRGVYVSNKS